VQVLKIASSCIYDDKYSKIKLKRNMQPTAAPGYLKRHLQGFWVFQYARFKSGSRAGKCRLELLQRS
jgi:predicted N-acyltransferase